MIKLHSDAVDEARQALVASAVVNGFKKDFNHVFRNVGETINCRRGDPAAPTILRGAGHQHDAHRPQTARLADDAASR